MKKRSLWSFAAVLLWASMISLVLAATAAACPNESLRLGSSANLPDCRAYELVTPPDANGRRFADVTVLGRDYDLFPYEPASPFQDSFLFSTIGSALATPGGGTGRNDGDVYETERTSAGWRVMRHITPTGAESVAPLAGGVSADHTYNFVFAPQFDGGSSEAGSLASNGEAGYLGAPDGTFELIGIGSLGNERLAQGRYISPGGQHVIFSTGRLSGGSQWCVEVGAACPVLKLEPNAPPTGTGAIYDRSANGPTKVVSLLPNDETPAAGQDAQYQGASKDGTTVAFKIGATLYVRVPDSGDGTTLKVSEGNSTYAGFSDDGHYLLYVVSGDIHRFDVTDSSDEQVNSTGDGEVVNASGDGSHVYFISKSPIGSHGTPGQPNMYVWSGVATKYIATMVPSDLEETSGLASGYPALTNWTWVVAPSGVRGPGTDSSQTTTDGEVMIFESRAKLTGYENDGHTEIYRFDGGTNELDCVSCNPLRTSATEDARLRQIAVAHVRTDLHNLSEDGNRVFFETPEALVEQDLDGINDVYEWHASPLEPSPVKLISPGTSPAYPVVFAPKENVLLGITPTGSDVFFLSQDALTADAGIGGISAIYDARVGGGFPVPATADACAGLDACQGAAVSPSSIIEQPKVSGRGGNVKPRRHSCRRRSHRKRTLGHKRVKGNHCKRNRARGGK